MNALNPGLIFPTANTTSFLRAPLPAAVHPWFTRWASLQLMEPGAEKETCAFHRYLLSPDDQTTTERFMTIQMSLSTFQNVKNYPAK